MQFTKIHVTKWLMGHRDNVSMKLSSLGNDLAIRGRRHDSSYLDSTECELFVEFLSQVDPKKKEQTKQLLDGIHCSRNDYCPEFFKKGISEMNFLQLLEYVCDRMVTLEESRADKNNRIPEIPFEEYQQAVLSGLGEISLDLQAILDNTIRYILNRNQVIKATIERAEKTYGEVEKK